jgi:hypothetical protein
MLLRTGQADKARPAPDFLGTTPSGCPLGRRTVFLRTAPAALGVPCRLGGVRPPVSVRETAYRAVRQLLGRLAGQAAPGRSLTVEPAKEPPHCVRLGNGLLRRFVVAGLRVSMRE